MNKTAIIWILGVLLIFNFESCKKGDNDPFLSLKSRNSRLKGTWKLVDGEETVINYDQSQQETTTTTKVDDGSMMAITVSVQDPSGTVTNAPFSITHTLQMTFEKDGSFNSSEILDGNSEIQNGYWYWSGKSKAQGLKKKETILITISEINDGQIDTYSGNAMTVDGSFQLDRLSNKELTVIIDEERVKSNGDIKTTKSILNFEKQ